jgi:hypothetical protein
MGDCHDAKDLLRRQKPDVIGGLKLWAKIEFYEGVRPDCFKARIAPTRQP